MITEREEKQRTLELYWKRVQDLSEEIRGLEETIGRLSHIRDSVMTDIEQLQNQLDSEE